MDRFFRPNAIAVVGASERKGGSQIIQNLLYGFKGPVYPVNPRYKEILGLKCYAGLEEIPSPVDLAIIFVPGPHVPKVLESCAQTGIKRVMIQSAGFAEVGAKGRAIQDRCTEISHEAGIRIWGPNCMGLVDIPNSRFFTFMNPRIYEKGFIPGNISLIVQSGMLSAGFLEVMRQRKIGVSKVCSIGNKSDIDECDLLPYLLEDEGTDVVVLYLESFPRGRLFAEIVAGSAKPIVVLKGGKSEAGARAAMSHTFSLAGNARLLESVLRMSGVILANDFIQMMELARGLALLPGGVGKRGTAIITFSGGAGILSCDLLEEHGLRVARFQEDTLRSLNDIFPEWMPASNPVDLFPAVERRGRVEAYTLAITSVLKDPGVDAVFVHYFGGMEEESLDLEGLKRQADAAGKALLFWSLGRREATVPFQIESLRCGLPVYDEVGRAVESLSASAFFEARKPPAKTCRNIHVAPPNYDPGEFDLSPVERRVWDEHDSKRLLSRWNIPVVEEILVPSLDEALAAAGKVGFPLVLKGLVPGEIHKTESGRVRLGIRDEHSLKMAYEEVGAGMKSGGRLVLQHHAEKDYELIAGFLRDPQFGPCVMFGLGGVLAEMQRDVAFSLAPLGMGEALRLMECLRGRRLLEGFRGIAPLDRESMAGILVDLGRLASCHSGIEQVDINPIVVKDGSPLAVDATIIVKPL